MAGILVHRHKAAIQEGVMKFHLCIHGHSIVSTYGDQVTHDKLNENFGRVSSAVMS